MVRRFRGQFDQKVDGKGRMSIPAPFRRVLEAGDPDWQPKTEPEVIIVFGDETQPYLECYTVDAANEVDAMIEEMDFGSVEHEMLVELFNGQSLSTTIDTTGRIVLPQKLREKLGVDAGEEVFMIATGRTFQMWHPDTYQKVKKARRQAWLAEQGEGFNPLSLLAKSRRTGVQ
ncbi:MAG: division/cell wall cluster transcriptional repressor MraZ [Pseudomonadota bacterium]